MTKTNDKTKAALEKKIRVAINELDQEGKRITNANVREKSGGSFRDVTPIVKAILAEREAREMAESQVPTMPEDVSELAAALWEAAFRAADSAAAEDRRARADEIKALKDEISDRENEIGILEDEKDQACARADAAERQVVEGAETVVQMRIATALLKGRVAGLLEALKAQTNEISSEDDAGTASTDIHSPLPFRASDEGNQMGSGHEPDGATVDGRAPDKDGEEGATGKAQAGKPAPRTRKVEYPETGDLPGISSPEASGEPGFAA